MDYSIEWARVSSREQDLEGFSLQSQSKLLRDYNKRLDLRVKMSFVVPESASGKQERKEFVLMLDFLKKHPEIKHLICEKVDRLSRNFSDAVKLDEWLNANPERKIHFVKQGLIIHKNSSSHEKFQWDIYLALARQYINNLSEEARKGLTAKAESGHYPGNKKFGYITTEVDKKRVWIKDPAKDQDLAYLKQAFELYAFENYTLLSLSRKMFELGWKTPAGNPIPKSTLHTFLTDCFYCGEYYWNKKHYTNAKHEPLISKEIFYKVQSRIKRKITAKYNKHAYTFGSGVMTCGVCGRSIIAEPQKNLIYYHCTRYNTNCTQKHYTEEHLIEKQLVDILDTMEVKNTRLADWIQKALKEHHSTQKDYQSQTLEGLNKEFSRIQERLDGLYDDKLDKKITQEFYDKKFEQYSKQQDTVLGAIQRLKEANINYYELGSKIFELSQKGGQIWQKKATIEQKRQLLNFVFLNLKLKDGKVEPTLKNGFDVIFKYAKNGNWLGDLDLNQDKRSQNPLSYR